MIREAMIEEKPDIETSSADYARRFAGRAGAYLLEVQTNAVQGVMRTLPAGTVLDVGGGHGQLVDPLTQLGWKVTVHGTDAECVKNLRELHGKRGCEYIEGSLFSLPVPDRSFDAVIAVRLLSHVDAWPRLLAEMCRVARTAVIVDYPSKFALNALTPMLFALKKSLEGNTRTYASFSRTELLAEYAQHGFGLGKEIKQFFMPMVVHRVGKGGLPFRALEGACRVTGLTALAGSPVILRVDRTRQ
jgi:ubiquinone/menaquinone biosynthesis C-methylase UbiE